MLSKHLNSVVELMCEDDKDADKLAHALAISLYPNVSPPDIYEAYVLCAYWCEIAGIKRRRAEEEDEENDYRDAEHILTAAVKSLDKALITAMHVNKNMRYET